MGEGLNTYHPLAAAGDRPSRLPRAFLRLHRHGHVGPTHVECNAGRATAAEEAPLAGFKGRAKPAPIGVGGGWVNLAGST